VAITTGAEKIMTDIAFDRIPEHRNKSMCRVKILVGHFAESHMCGYAPHATVQVVEQQHFPEFLCLLQNTEPIVAHFYRPGRKK
jgi:hypothetical protein